VFRPSLDQRDLSSCMVARKSLSDICPKATRHMAASSSREGVLRPSSIAALMGGGIVTRGSKLLTPFRQTDGELDHNGSSPQREFYPAALYVTMELTSKRAFRQGEELLSVKQHSLSCILPVWICVHCT
jgi:hypothetical protein